MTRWRGLAELVQDAVHHGSLAVERVHQRVARTPLEILAIVPPLATGARRLADCQAAAIGATYHAIRGVNGTVAAIAFAVADAAEARADPSPATAGEDAPPRRGGGASPLHGRRPEPGPRC